MAEPTKHFSRFMEESFLLQERHEYSAVSPYNITYSGYADPGVAEDEVGWMIVKYNHDSNNLMDKKTFANGRACFECEWTNRGDYAYS